MVLLLCAATPITLLAQTLTTLASLNGGGGNVSGVVEGTDGNFYGTTPSGGSSNNGTVFKVTPSGALTILHNFCPQPPCTDGATPKAGLIQASDGNFYGTTSGGGAAKAGTVFKITPAGTLTVLYSFCSQAGCADGTVPQAGLIQASDGNFYGTTSGGENNDSPVLTGGTVFKITPGGTATTLYSFCARTPCVDGGNTFAGLIQASDGNFYGTTWGGGTANVGTVFKVTPGGILTTLHSFCTQAACVDGAGPLTGLMQASDGNFYGTTPIAGAYGGGVIFKITPGGTLNPLYSFCPQTGCADGSGPAAGLMQASDGNFYGTTYNGGSNSGGTAFKITPGGALTILHSFCSQTGCADGKNVYAGLIQGTDGNLYGTTSGGGANGGGTVFRLQLANTSAPYSCATQPVIKSINSAGAYGGYSYFASGSWLEIKGANLANPADPRLTAAINPGQWTSSDFNGVNAPTVLDNISVSVNGKPAYIWYLSTTQLNVQAPEDTATGNVPITVNNCSTASAPFQFARRPLAPGLLAPPSFMVNSTQYMAATFASDGAYVLSVSTGAALRVNSRPAKPGDLIVAYGIGFGDVTPAILPGVIVQQGNALVNPVTISFGSTPATLAYAGLAGNFVGLYEFFVTVPSGLADGDYQINMTQNGATIPQTMYLTVHN
jgi:uncharacterized protein (TIGR03437 family)